MIANKGRPKSSKNKLSQSYYVEYKSHMDVPVPESRASEKLKY
jgi:hypothetical protein